MILACVTVAAVHFVVGTETHQQHVVHVIFGGLFLLPVIAGAVWFGPAGGLGTATAVSLLYFAHMRKSWPDQPMENANQLAMIAVYELVGATTGGLALLRERERDRRLRVERHAQRETIVQGLASLATALGSRDGYTLAHSHNVSRLAVALGGRCGLDADRLEVLRLAALVHDIGKIGVRDDVLLKPHRLTADEMREIHRHPAVAAEILRSIQGTEAIANVVLCHHEKLDGTGYPRGLRGGQIPLGARILSVADVFCALTEDRPYKPAANGVAEALGILRSVAGTELDRSVIGHLEELLAETDRRSPRSVPDASGTMNAQASAANNQAPPVSGHATSIEGTPLASWEGSTQEDRHEAPLATKQATT